MENLTGKNRQIFGIVLGIIGMILAFFGLSQFNKGTEELRLEGDQQHMGELELEDGKPFDFE